MGSPDKAIYIGPKNELFLKEYRDPYEPGNDQALVQVQYSGVNPADLKHGLEFGLNDYVCGYEFSGKIIRAGKGFPYEVGDEIYGSKKIGLGSEFGAHQDLLLAEGNTLIAKRPSTIPSEAAAAMSLVVRTAADALFNIMAIPFAKINAAGKPSKSGILVWGGGSAVGWAAVQLAKAAGLSPIITTASASNHQSLKELGATHCFDYRDDDVVVKIQDVIDASGQPLKYIFDAVCSRGQASSTSSCDALKTATDAIFVGTLPVLSDQRQWIWCLAARAWELHLPPPIGHVPANEEWESRLVDIVSWVADHYERGFRIPNLRVIEGVEAAIAAIKSSGEGKIRFEKVVIKHPF
ncbi:uncharacterized protein Z518_10091 [Rhinocladiella mackenziei CBS 650.93]|uniref:Enoyl reductase (ER) domain-containing protein n=1 Tax=Rhinocladiella mackenziei CBS 650.93 TaxID=1442369 RepID=A0A0D2IWP6_9EURO|nr:uncharacterized protein Z518_10091 [Rhinocladiella mackenziei CBS 650.93]KIX01025.1 hypothetical protein Z518_10091 [Rhinocladiella mackenziei CBS 650.93]